MNDVQVVYSGTSGIIRIDPKVLGLTAIFYGLPGHEVEDAAPKQSTGLIGPSDLPSVPSTEAKISRSNIMLHPELGSEKQWPDSTSPENRKTWTAHTNSGALNMLTSPEISGLLKTRLHIDPEIQTRLGDERHIKFALSNIVNIIADSLKNLGFDYRVDAYLRGNEYSEGWERMELIIEFPDEYYDDIEGHWKNISMRVSEFYKSLQNNPEFSDDIIIRIRKFIYIIVQSEE